MKNAIPDRVYNFLKIYPPFSLLEKKDLEDLAAKVIIQYLQPNEFVFKEGAMPKEHIEWGQNRLMK